MDNKKHIDRLFQEKLKDFEAVPDNSVWENISKELNKDKRDRKIIPFWWRFGGVAAGLVLIITLGINFFPNNNNAIQNNSKNPIVDSNTLQNIESNESINNNSNSTDSSVQKDETIFNINNKAIVTNSNLNKEENSKSILSKNKSTINKLNPQNEKVVANNFKKSKTLDSQEILKESDINNVIENNNNSIESSVVQNQNEKTNEELLLKNNESEDDKVDLLKAIEDKKEDLTKEDKDNYKKWSVASNIAPVYFNSLGEGSSIHEQFNKNSKTGDINMSYGVSASYAVTKKLKVRAGVNKVNLGYSTKDVAIYSDTEAISLGDLSVRNINFNETGKNLSFVNSSNFYLTQVPESLSNTLKASLDQKLGFIEVPLELEYRILDKKLGLNVIGGFSVLFLNDNEVYSVLDGQSTLLGEATNINNTSYSANFGLGLDYKILKKLDLNLEPVFKYQINTFNNTSGDFRPYFIGIYSGLKFKF